MMLDKLRQDISAIDDELVTLFCRRMALSSEVAAYKQAHGVPVLDASRENAVLARVAGKAEEPCRRYVQSLYHTIFDLSRSRQHALLGGHAPLTEEIRAALAAAPDTFPAKATVACQGISGAYSQQACDKLFSSPEIIYCRSFEAVFQAVENGLCQFGILPVENSTHGSVEAVYDLLQSHRVCIVRSTKLHVQHALLALPGVKKSDIRQVVSHEQALGQCSHFFAAHPEIQATDFPNTAMAAQHVAASGRKDLAAIASPACAAQYGLTALPGAVQNTDNNYTRFICITRNLIIYPGANRISLILATPHKPGALYRVLSRFAAVGINLTGLHSRPVPGSDFEFRFHLDFEGSVRTPEVLDTLGGLSQEDASFAFLGNWAEA